MSIMNVELYDAFRDLGRGDLVAREAAILFTEATSWREVAAALRLLGVDSVKAEQLARSIDMSGWIERRPWRLSDR